MRRERHLWYVKAGDDVFLIECETAGEAEGWVRKHHPDRRTDSIEYQGTIDATLRPARARGRKARARA